MFERFTERARQTVILAQEEARTLKHGYIGTEHILLGILREEEGVGCRALESFDVTVEGVRAEVVRLVGMGEEVKMDQIPFTPRAKKVLELALREALSLGHNYIGTEHVLLGLVRENEGVAARILLDFGTDSEKIRNEVIRMLSGPGGRQRGSLSETIPPMNESMARHLEDMADQVISMAQTLRENAPAETHDYPLILGNSGVAQITRERIRQVEEEGWSAHHDDDHTKGELADAAAVYASPRVKGFIWPNGMKYKKTPDRIRELVKAGALIAAEIDRLRRKEG